MKRTIYWVPEQQQRRKRAKIAVVIYSNKMFSVVVRATVVITMIAWVTCSVLSAMATSLFPGVEPVECFPSIFATILETTTIRKDSNKTTLVEINKQLWNEHTSDVAFMNARAA